MFLCALVGPLCPPPPAPCRLFVPFLCVRPSCRWFFFCARASCCSRAPCLCPLLFFDLPWSRCPPPPLSPVSLPILLLAVDPACTSTLPARASLSLLCATPVPYPCPSLSPLPFPLGAPSVPASHPILAAWRPVCGGLNWSGVYPPLCSSRACSTTLIAYSDCACHADSSFLPSSLVGVRVGLLLQGSGHCRLRTEVGA